MHKLAKQYYGFRAFWLLFLPLTIVSTVTTILGFLSTGRVEASSETGEYNFDNEPRRALAVSIGVLGAIATMLTTLGKYTGYQSKTDMHMAAVKALEKIHLQVTFEQQWFDRARSKEEHEIPTNATRNKNKKNRTKQDHPDESETTTTTTTTLDEEQDLHVEGTDLKTHQASFHAMQESCDSPIPAKILSAFTLLQQRFPYKYGSLPRDNATYFYNKLWDEFTQYPAWPVLIPHIDIKKKFKDWSDKYQNLSGATSMDQSERQQTALNLSEERRKSLRIDPDYYMRHRTVGFKNGLEEEKQEITDPEEEETGKTGKRFKRIRRVLFAPTKEEEEKATAKGEAKAKVKGEAK